MFALTSLVGLLVNVAFYGLIFVLSLYFQQVNGDGIQMHILVTQGIVITLIGLRMVFSRN